MGIRSILSGSTRCTYKVLGKYKDVTWWIRSGIGVGIYQAKLRKSQKVLHLYQDSVFPFVGPSVCSFRSLHVRTWPQAFCTHAYPKPSSRSAFAPVARPCHPKVFVCITDKNDIDSLHVFWHGLEYTYIYILASSFSGSRRVCLRDKLACSDAFIV